MSNASRICYGHSGSSRVPVHALSRRLFRNVRLSIGRAALTRRLRSQHTKRSSFRAHHRTLHCHSMGAGVKDDLINVNPELCRPRSFVRCVVLKVNCDVPRYGGTVGRILLRYSARLLQLVIRSSIHWLVKDVEFFILFRIFFPIAFAQYLRKFLYLKKFSNIQYYTVYSRINSLIMSILSNIFKKDHNIKF